MTSESIYISNEYTFNNTQVDTCNISTIRHVEDDDHEADCFSDRSRSDSLSSVSSTSTSAQSPKAKIKSSFPETFNNSSYGNNKLSDLPLPKGELSKEQKPFNFHTLNRRHKSTSYLSHRYRNHTVADFTDFITAQTTTTSSSTTTTTNSSKQWHKCLKKEVHPNANPQYFKHYFTTPQNHQPATPQISLYQNYYTLAPPKAPFKLELKQYQQEKLPKQQQQRQLNKKLSTKSLSAATTSSHGSRRSRHYLSKSEDSDFDKFKTEFYGVYLNSDDEPSFINSDYEDEILDLLFSSDDIVTKKVISDTKNKTVEKDKNEKKKEKGEGGNELSVLVGGKTVSDISNVKKSDSVLSVNNYSSGNNNDIDKESLFSEIDETEIYRFSTPQLPENEEDTKIYNNNEKFSKLGFCNDREEDMRPETNSSSSVNSHQQNLRHEMDNNNNMFYIFLVLFILFLPFLIVSIFFHLFPSTIVEQ